METIRSKDSGDSHARYTFPTLEAFLDTRSKQRKTWLPNLQEAATKLHRPPELLLQWLQAAEGATGGCDTAAGYPRYFIKGHVEVSRLREHVRDFCASLVVCPICEGCDTELYATHVSGTKKRPERRISMKCSSSGCDTPVHLQGALHSHSNKLCRHIPEKPSDAFALSGHVKESRSAPRTHPDEDEETVEWWSVGSDLGSDPFSPSAVAARKAALLGNICRPRDVDPPSEEAALEHALGALEEQVAGLDNKRTREVIRDAGGDMVAPACAQLTLDQRFILVESLPKRLAKSADYLLMHMYDCDIVTEADILGWHQQANQENRAVRKATRFVDWLVAAKLEE